MDLADNLVQHDFEDVLKVGNLCTSYLKKGGVEVRSVLSEICRIFKSNDIEYFPPTPNLDGADLLKAFDLNGDKWSVDRYAEHYWRYDPLYNYQFCLAPTNLVFKTDDIIPYNQLVNLDYYQNYLRPTNWFSELVIRLCNREGFFGTISVSRQANQPCFDNADIQKAELLLPFLLDSFESTRRFSTMDEERRILEQWAESHQEGLIFLNSDLRLLYSNNSAQRFCDLLSESKMTFGVPSQILQDCQNILQNSGDNSNSVSKNRIINTRQGGKYYIGYLLVNKAIDESNLPCIIISMRELNSSDQNADSIFVKGSMFSSREQTIIQYAAGGLTNKEIGKLLFISPFTVQNHLQHIFEKTGLKNRTQLASLAKQL